MKKLLLFVIALISVQAISAAEISGKWRWVSEESKRWGNAGHTGDGHDFLTGNSPAMWWGVTSAAGFSEYTRFESLPDAADYASNDAYMEFSGNKLTSYRADGSVIASTTFAFDIYADGRNNNWEIGKLNTAGAGVLFPYQINTDNTVTNFDVMAFDGANLILVYTGSTVGGSWGEVTFWCFENVDLHEIQGIRYTLDNATQTATVVGNGGNYKGNIEIPAKIGELGTVYTVTAVASGAFADCNKLTGVSLPNTVETIGSDAFANSSIVYFNVPENLTKISEGMFYGCNSLVSIVLPSKLTSIEDNAFKGCVNLGGIEIPSTVTSIGKSAFKDCRKLASISLPAGIKTIGRYAFADCTALHSIALPSGLKVLEMGAFGACPNLNDVTLNEGLETIEGDAFKNCIELDKITLPSTLKAIYGGAFENTKLASIYFPASLETFEGAAFYGCKYLESVYVDPQNPNFISYDEVVYTKDKTGLIMYAPGRIYYNYKVIEGTRYIATGAFTTCNNLQYLHLPSTLQEVKLYAFYESKEFKYVSIKAVTPPATDEFISFVALPESCILEVPEGTKDAYNASRWRIPLEYEWDGVTHTAFMHIEEAYTPHGEIGTCTWELYGGVLTISPAEGQTTGTMPTEEGFYAPWANFADDIYAVVYAEGVTNTGSYIFAGAPYLKSVELASSVQAIDEGAFVKCENLESVTCLATTPPAMSDMAFSGEDYALYVPEGATAAYSSAGYAKFFNISEDMPTGIGCMPSTLAGNASAGIYSINGTRMSTLRKGINIVKMNDGSVRKIMVK